MPTTDRAVGPMAGVVSASMQVLELEDPVHGGRAWCSLNEGLGTVLRYGAYGPAVLERLRWMSAVLGPLLGSAVRRHGPVDVRAVIAQIRTGVLPQINTGIAGRVAGTGQVGAGLVTPPPECFDQALEALAAAAPPL